LHHADDAALHQADAHARARIAQQLGGFYRTGGRVSPDVHTDICGRWTKDKAGAVVDVLRTWHIESTDPNTRDPVVDPVIKVPLAEPEVNVSPLEASDECVLSEECIDQYLWSVYERARKVDTIKVQEQIKTTVKKNGKSRTVTKTVTKFVTEDFTWKDPDAAEKAGMSVAQYVIGGIDRAFKARLYHLFRALDDAGLAPGMTSGFRDDYRQSITSGHKAATGNSYHGGSRRGGYGHGLAADVVSVKGETRSERSISSEIMWKWIDAHGKEYGIGRPYLDKDPPHIAPIDGKEYADKRGLNAKVAEKGNAATSGVAKAAKPRQALQGRAEPKPLL
jgi:hypothetical protein